MGESRSHESDAFGSTLYEARAFLKNTVRDWLYRTQEIGRDRSIARVFQSYALAARRLELQ